jgi:hypothetical protein
MFRGKVMYFLKLTKINFFILLLFFITANFDQIFAKDNVENVKKNVSTANKLSISDEYLGIKLGTERNKVLALVDKHPLLDKDEETYYGDFDAEQKYIIKVKKPPIIDNIYLQFIPKDGVNYTDFSKLEKDENWVLYMIIIHFNPKYNSYNNLCEKITFKYGTPNKRTPYKATWKQRENNVKLVIENPSTIKIINVNNFLSASRKYKTYKAITNKDYKKDIYNSKFLKDFE